MKRKWYRLYARYGKMFIPTRFRIRPATYFVNTMGKKDLVVAEIGVFLGYNAESLIKTLSIKKLYLVDIEVRPSALRRLSKYRNQIEFIEKSSEESSNIIPNELDFVYIDGSHEYEDVKKDIELYYPKVKEGGVIGGHDFDSEHIGVCKSVIEFANSNGLDICGKHKDWWFLK